MLTKTKKKYINTFFLVKVYKYFRYFNDKSSFFFLVVNDKSSLKLPEVDTDYGGHKKTKASRGRRKPLGKDIVVNKKKRHGI